MTIKITTGYNEHKTAQEMADSLATGGNIVTMEIDTERKEAGIITEFRGK